MLDAEADRTALKIIRTLGVMQDALGPRRLSSLRAHVFIKVAMKDGQSVSEIAEAVGANLSTVSRQLLDMGRANRFGEKGQGFIEARKNPLDPRVTAHYLTPKGRALREAILVCLRDEIEGGRRTPVEG